MTDPRLAKMNTARWVLAHQQQIDKERRLLKTWSRFFGNDMNMYEKDAEGQPKWDEEMPKVFPLAAILNPEAFSHLTKDVETQTFEDSIPDDTYEQQIRQLEESGALTDIDVASVEAEKKISKKKSRIVEE